MTSQNNKVDAGRRKMLVGASAVVGAVGSGLFALPLLGSWVPSEKAKAVGAPIEMDITKLEKGKQLKALWRGKVIYILRMTVDMQKTLTEVEKQGVLLDAKSEKGELPKSLAGGKGKRQLRDDIMVLIGVCTHLGCAPIQQDATSVSGKKRHKDWLGGFYCSCHGSDFDYSGRVFKGVPAPTNLAIPPHKFLSDDLVIIGEEA